MYRPRLIASAAATLALVAVSLPSSAAGGTSPALKAKRAEAAFVLKEISVLDERLSVLTERYDGARFHLQTIETHLRAERASLTRARNQYHQATQQIARLIVSLYTSAPPSSLEAIIGAGSFAKMLAIADDQRAIAHARTQIATNAKAARIRVQASVVALRTDRDEAAHTVRELNLTKQTVEQGLATRQRLLASVKAQVAHLQAEQRAEQQRLLAAARARLAAEEKAAAERAARAKAAAVAREQAAATQATSQSATTNSPGAATDPPSTTTVPGDPTTTDPSTTDQTSTTTTTTPEPLVTAPGHPEAAALALDYIGVPYLWGGATPAGFDCSGLVMYIFAQLGIQLPHFAAAQYTYGVPVPRDQLQPGDLVFFDNLDHVGIYIGANEIVNAPHTGTFVRIDSLSEPWYANRYVGARRI